MAGYTIQGINLKNKTVEGPEVAGFLAISGPISTKFGALLETPCEHVNIKIQDD